MRNRSAFGVYAPYLGLMLAFSGLAAAGCRSDGNQERSGSWLDVFKPRPKLVVTTAPANDGTRADAPGTPAQPLTVLMLHFDVLRAQAPLGTFSTSGKIWNHLDEQVVPASLAPVLQRNGLRVARGKIASWAPIKALLDTEPDVTSYGNAMNISNGQPLTLELDAQPHDQTLFLFRPDGSCPGATFPGSMNLLRLEYDIPADNPDAVLVSIMPEVRLQPPEAGFTPKGWVTPPPVAQSRVFRELAVQVLVKPDEFLALGPSAGAHSAHTIGGLMLTQDTLGRRFESMFFITPRVVRKNLPGANGSSGPAAAPAGR